ncbi:MAG: aldo/keto reductase [Syntrophaceae bacterium]|nr:aldo/keto reductase [Syntrophaceae bacterium]
MGKINRRDFFRSSVAGLGGFLVLPALDHRAEEGKGEKSKGQKKFLYRNLGKTGVKLPVITMGVMNSDNPNLIRAALEAGMYHLDTAHGYMRGKNEEVIGSVIKGRPRDSFFIATKIYLPRDESSGLPRETATEQFFLSRLDTSLKRLGLDHVDILYHHNVWTRDFAFYEPALKGLEKAKKDGKVRFAGITTHRNEPEVIEAAVESKFYEVIQIAYNHRQKHGPKIREALAKAGRAGLGVVAMKTLGGGQRNLEKAEARAALKWVLQDPNVNTIIAGFTTFDQLELDLSVMEDLTLKPAEKSLLERMKMTAGLYCQGCEQCLQSCRQNLPIPDLMRGYMYVYGYRNLIEAQDLLASLNLPSTLCQDCGSCRVKCASGFDVPARIRDVVRLREVPPEFLSA